MRGSFLRRRGSGGHRAGGGGGSSFNDDTPPPDLGGGSGLRLYVALGHGLYTDAGTTLATAASDLIYRWKDYSGNSNHLEQATSVNRPSAGTAAQCVFASTFFGVPSGVISGVTDGEVFGLLKSDTDTQPGTNCGLWNFGGGDVGVYGNFAGNIDEGAGTTGRYNISGTTGRTVWHVYSVRTSGTTWEALHNNSAISTQGSNTAYWGTSPSMGISLGSGLFFYGQCAALVFYAGARSSGERASIVSTLLGMAPP